MPDEGIELVGPKEKAAHKESNTEREISMRFLGELREDRVEYIFVSSVLRTILDVWAWEVCVADEQE